MDDFASARMLRLLQRAMAAHGMTPPLPWSEDARVHRQQKQEVVTCIVRAGGLPLLLALAQQVHHIHGEPLHRALTGSRDPHDFVQRWQRLERYVHASHRVMLRHSSPQSLTLQHCSLGTEAPGVAESVAVLGAWIGALQTIGVRGLRVTLADQPVWGDGATPVWTMAPMDPWHLAWTHQADPGPRSPDATVSTDDSPGSAALLDGPLPWPSPAAELARWLCRDLSSTPRAADAAAALELRLRTLQRRLTAAGLSFSELLGAVRVRAAAAWLARPGPSLAEIGYLCGYADQAHFTREFSRRAGMPPARFRAAATGAQGA